MAGVEYPAPGPRAEPLVSVLASALKDDGKALALAGLAFEAIEISWIEPGSAAVRVTVQVREGVDGAPEAQITATPA